MQPIPFSPNILLYRRTGPNVSATFSHVLPFPAVSGDMSDIFGLMRTARLGDFHLLITSFGSDAFAFELVSHVGRRRIVSCQMCSSVTSNPVTADNFAVVKQFTNFESLVENCSHCLALSVLFRVIVAYLHSAPAAEMNEIANFTFFDRVESSDPSDEERMMTSGLHLNSVLLNSSWNSVSIRLPSPSLRDWIDCNPVCPSGNERILFGLPLSQVWDHYCHY